MITTVLSPLQHRPAAALAMVVVGLCCKHALSVTDTGGLLYHWAHSYM